MSEARVLVVEDNRADARLLQEIFAEIPGRPFTLTVVGTLAEALPRLAEHDVVMLDLSLPDAHGLPTVERSVQAARGTPIVVLTGNADERTATEAVKAGAQDYLYKAEITPSLVARSIRYAIERKRLEAAEVARAKSDDAAERARFLAAAIAEVTRSLELREAMQGLARVVVPRLADFAVIDILQDDGRVLPLAYSGDPGEPPPMATGDVGPLLEALRRRTTVRVADLGFAHRGERERWLEQTQGARALLITPLIAREQVFGTVSYVLGPSLRRHDVDDQLLAEEVAAHAALAVENMRLYAQAQRAIAGRDELLAIVSHDLRNPINVISLALGLLHTPDEARRAQNVARARRAVERMQRLIHDLLDVARIDAGTLQVEPAPVPLVTVLDDAFELYRPLCGEKSIQLAKQYDDGLGVGLVDRDRVAQVLGNLIGNALKFTAAGGTIRLLGERRSNELRIGVSDTGVGIAAENLPCIFDRFWQKEQRRDGVGLGLAIAKGIVEAHGGSLQVESAPGVGTTFWFTLRPSREDISSPGAAPAPR